jgi:uncharacterized RDD family membrane protein YckC
MGRSGFWIRALAAAIDMVVWLVLLIIVIATLWILEVSRGLSGASQRMLDALPLALWLAYSSMEAVIGATVGKLATGIVIALPDGAPAPPWTRVLRWSTKQGGWVLAIVFLLTDYSPFYMVSGMLNGVLSLGVLRVLDEDKRAWHDYWCHTAVVPRKRAAAMRGVHEEPVGLPPPT